MRGEKTLTRYIVVILYAGNQLIIAPHQIIILKVMSTFLDTQSES